jgi:hypothetical protein
MSTTIIKVKCGKTEIEATGQVNSLNFDDVIKKVCECAAEAEIKRIFWENN